MSDQANMTREANLLCSVCIPSSGRPYVITQEQDIRVLRRVSATNGEINATIVVFSFHNTEVNTLSVRYIDAIFVEFSLFECHMCIKKALFSRMSLSVQADFSTRYVSIAL